MWWRIGRNALLATAALAMATPSFAVAEPTASSDLEAEQVRGAFRDAGYVTSDLGWWAATVLTFGVSDAVDGPTILRVFVYSDSLTAAREHERALANEEARRGRSILDSDDRGPQLLTGFGLSAWRRNVAMVQASSATDVGAFPVEPDCAPTVVMTAADDPGLASPDRVFPTTTVDPVFIELLEDLP